ncbi:MAG: putative porin [Geobacteraceae bacterium]|nr:putative porin [Geobacteraceae bacterium]
MKFRCSMIAGLAVLTLLGGIAPAYSAEEVAPAAAAPGIGELLRLLEEKKVITPEESRELGRKFSQDAGSAGAAKEDETAAAEAGLPTAPFAPEEAAEALDILSEEGIISEEEKVELAVRLDELGRKVRGELVPERQRPAVGADDIEYRMTTVPVEEVRDRLRFLALQHVLTRREAAQAFERYGRKHPADQLAEGVTAEVGKDVRRRIGQKFALLSEIQGKTDKLPEWLNRFKLSGDIRLRYQGEFFDENNNPTYQSPYNLDLINTLADRHRLRTRARLGVNAKVNDQVEAGIRLATGNEKDPVSTNDTLGDYFNKDGFVLDLAYLRWRPLTGLTLWGGRLPSPWFATDLVWDPDLNFEGVAASYTHQITDALGGFLTAGIFPLEELEFSQRDKWLWGAQIGGEYRPHENVGMKLGVAYYRFENMQGRPFETPDLDNFSGFGINVTNTQKGNTVFNLNLAGTAHFPGLGSKFEELNVTAALDLGFWDPVHLVFMGDYVNNLGFNRDEVFTLSGDSGVGNDNEGYQLGVTVGHQQVKDAWQWKTYLFYKRLEADAVVDLFTDSDFHLGGTNAEGWIVGGDLGLNKNFWLSAKWLTANQINDRTFTPGPFDVDVFQFNLNAKF